MIFIELSIEVQITVFITLIAVLIDSGMSIVVCLNGIFRKKKILIVLGICLATLFSPYWPSSLGYLYWIFTGGSELSFQFQAVIGIAFMPIALLSFLEIYRSFHRRKVGNFLILISLIYTFFLEIYIFYVLFFIHGAPVEGLVASYENLRLDYNGFLLLSMFMIYGMFFSSLLDFSISSIEKEASRKARTRGLFLIFGTTLSSIVLVFEYMGVYGSLIFNIFTRVLLIIVIFTFYLGLLMPNWFLKLLNIENEEN